MGSVSDDEAIKLYDPVIGLLVMNGFRVVVGFVVVFVVAFVVDGFRVVVRFVVVFVVAFVVVVNLCIGLCGKALLAFRKNMSAKIIVNSLIENILVEYFSQI